MNFTQLEPEHIYEVPYGTVDPYYSRDSVRVKPENVASLLVGLVVAVTLWGWIMWRLTSKAGYRGAARWIWFVFLGFPITTGWSLLVFVLLPWPVQKRLKREPAGLPQSDIERELNQLRTNLKG
jgi:hypothetical protein